MSIIGETIVTVAIEMLVEKLVSDAINLFERPQKIRAALEELKKNLKIVKAVLDDADEKQTTNSSVKNWLGELQSLAYDVEDLLDEFATRALRNKLVSEPAVCDQPSTSTFQKFIPTCCTKFSPQNDSEPAVRDQPSTSMFQKLIPTCCTKFSPENRKFDSNMESEIEKITDRFKVIVSQKDLLGLTENLGGRSKNASRRQETTTSLVIESEVQSREEEKKTMVELLLQDDSKSVDGVFSVIPITGMGGLGKTTLAQLVYNDNTVESQFELKAWACVSEDYDAERITKAILKSFRMQTEADDDLDTLQVKLKDGLSGKKFLIVLDDMWNESYGDWTNLRRPFAAGAKGSKIIVTTRNRDVASMMKTGSTDYELKKLTDQGCMRVFTQHCLGAKDFSEHQHFEDIGEKIVKKCNGLPLAAKTLGGLLRGKDDLHDWRKVLNSQIWDLPGEGSDIMRALRVSYHFLPAHLKRCFAHCSLLPKDYEFDKSEIVLLWMAEGLLPLDTSGKKMEEFGQDYFQELLSRSFFQQSSTGTTKFVMHDLINDLSQWAAAGGMYFRMEDPLESNQQQRFSKTLRHFSYVIGQYDGIKRFEAISDVKSLRTFLPVILTSGRKHFLSGKIVYKLLKLQRLKVLSLSGYQIFEIPNSVGDLEHLRHLDLSGTELEILPESINRLFNLNTLLLQNCGRLMKLCEHMGNLVKLHHLNNQGAVALGEMPLGIDKLTCLQTLSYFVVGKNNSSQIRQLKFLDNLCGELKISKLENVSDGGDAKEAKLNGKQHLNVLFLEWASNNDNPKKPETEQGVLDMLKPHENLKELTVRGYGGVKFPIWLGSSTLGKLVLLRFENCVICSSLPSLGQLPHLEHLYIIGMTAVKKVGLEFYGNGNSMFFPSLKTLCFEDMTEWEDWFPLGTDRGVKVLPKLQELSLVKCSKLLRSLPKYLPSLKRLVIHNCEQLEVLVPDVSTICKLEIRGCKKVVWRSATDDSSLNSMVSNETSNQVFLKGVIEKELTDLEEVAINNREELTYLWRNGRGLLQDISSLQQFKIACCPKLISLVASEENDQQQQEFLCRLHYLEVINCRRLVKLPQALFSVSSLQKVNISECASLVSFPEAALPSQLREISIGFCNSLKSLPQAWMHSHSTSLEKLVIFCCRSLTFIARVQLPTSLKWVKISNCKKLRTLIDEEDLNSLIEHLQISDCQSLTSLWSKSELPATLEHLDVRRCSDLALLSSRGNLPKALKNLWLSNVPKLESIVERLDNNTSLESLRIVQCKNLRFLPDGLQELQNLQQVKIDKCPNLVSFPEGGLTSKKLTELYLSRCKKLKSLPNSIHNLSSTHHLSIINCPSIESFPEDGLPRNLSLLTIYDLKIFKPLFDWGLVRLTSIKRLNIKGCPQKEDTGMMLPESVTHLSFQSFPNLERLSSSFKNLTSLESLELQDCPNLRYFPEHGFPDSLLRLQIIKCPMIEGMCKKDQGHYWPLIAHLPCVRID